MTPGAFTGSERCVFCQDNVGEAGLSMMLCAAPAFSDVALWSVD